MRRDITLPSNPEHPLTLNVPLEGQTQHTSATLPGSSKWFFLLEKWDEKTGRQKGGNNSSEGF